MCIRDSSIPAAWIGGRLPISETLFIGLLSVALLLAGLRLLFVKLPERGNETRPTPMLLAALIGTVLGGLAGLVGIGGGIFLAPVLYGLNGAGLAKSPPPVVSLFWSIQLRVYLVKC